MLRQIRVILILCLSFQVSAQNNQWYLAEDKAPEGITYEQLATGTIARVLSLEEIEQLAYRKIVAKGRELIKDQLEFILSVLTIDMDEAIFDESQTIPILSGKGYSEEGEVAFAVTYKDLKSKSTVLLISSNIDLNLLPEMKQLRAVEFIFPKVDKEHETKQPQETAQEQIPRDRTIVKSTLKKYPIPTGTKNSRGQVYWKGWNYKDDFHARAGSITDPIAPKFALEVVSIAKHPKRKAAIEEALRINNINVTSYESLERMEVSKEMVGNDMFFTIGKSIMAGEEAVLFLRIEKVKNSSNYFVLIMEASKRTYIEWGGISSMLLATQVIKTMSSIPKERRQQIAQATPKQQIRIYEEAYTSLMKQYYMGIMMTQSQALLRMQELNYDLILGGDITDPLIGN